MRAAVVTDFTRPPQYGEFREPVAAPGHEVVEVEASAVHRLVRSIAAGAHYSSEGGLPLVPGVDGVARLADGSRVYTGGVEEPFGMLAERSNPTDALRVPVPEGLDSAIAAAIVNPGMSGWIPLARLLRPGATVLVLGATGVSGGLAVRAARLLGAGRVVAAGRDPERLAATSDLGADARIPLDHEDPLAALREAAPAYDVVLDYVWAAPAIRFMTALARTRPDPARPVEWAQIGSTAGPDATLPSAVLRQAAIRLSGSGIGSVPRTELLGAITGVLDAAAAGALTIDVEEHPLADVEATWNRPGRLVYRP